jgi:hypothetical protein
MCSRLRHRGIQTAVLTQFDAFILTSAPQSAVLYVLRSHRSLALPHLIGLRQSRPTFARSSSLRCANRHPEQFISHP